MFDYLLKNEKNSKNKFQEEDFQMDELLGLRFPAD